MSLPRVLKARVRVTTKPDGSPVTDVDHEVEQLLRARIHARRPQDLILGKEAGETGPKRSRWRWYLDPIDGTKRYVAGDPKWMTLIALAYDGELVVGVVDYPALGERWWASLGYGAFHDGQPIHVSRVARLSESVICDDWRQTIAEDRNPDHPLVRVAGGCARIAPHHGHGSLAVAAGHADIAIATGSYAWDHAAPKLIVTEAGGRHTDFNGGSSLDRREALVTNGQLHGQALAVINQLDLDDRSAR